MPGGKCGLFPGIEKLHQSAEHKQREAENDLLRAVGRDRLLEIATAEKGGRLVVLPVKIGDKIYRLFDGEIQNLLVSNVIYRAIGGDACRIIVECIPFHRCYWREDFGKTVFPTREEAEAVLREQEG